jgi:biopolymer transport protein ExbD
MGMSAGPKGGIKNEINITPLVDVVLVLLIIFMVVTPMLQRGKSVTLPKSKSTEKEKKDADPLILSITLNKQVYLENDQLDDAALEVALRRELQKKPDRRILLKGDEKLSYGEVRRVMNVARKAGARGINLGVEELKAN